MKKSNEIDGFPALYYLKLEALERICSSLYYSGDYKEHGKQWKKERPMVLLDQKRIHLDKAPIIQALDIKKKYNLFIGALYRDNEFDYSGKVFCSCANYAFVHRPKNNQYDNEKLYHCKHIKRLAYIFLETYHQWIF